MAFRHALLRTTVRSGLAALAFAPAAMAQQASDVDELVVTGSRIKSNTYTSSSPIQVITGETQTLQGLVDTAEVLQRSSLASGSFQVNNQLTGFVTTGGPGVNTINLRGLGSKQQPGDTGFGEPLHIHIQGACARMQRGSPYASGGRWPRGECAHSCRPRSEPDPDREGRV